MGSSLWTQHITSSQASKERWGHGEGGGEFGNSMYNSGSRRTYRRSPTIGYSQTEYKADGRGSWLTVRLASDTYSCNMEVALHTIQDCPASREVWVNTWPARFSPGFFLLPLRDWMLQCLSLRRSSLEEGGCSERMAITLWNLWKWRNLNVFEGGIIPLQLRLESINRAWELGNKDGLEKLNVPEGRRPHFTWGLGPPQYCRYWVISRNGIGPVGLHISPKNKLEATHIMKNIQSNFYMYYKRNYFY